MPVRAAQNLLTTGEIARAIGVSSCVVAKWHSQGLLPAFRLPGSGRQGKGERRFRIPDVVAFCFEQGLPFVFDGLEEPAPGGLVVAATQDERVIDGLRACDRCIIHLATCTADAAFQVARFLPGILVLDTTVVSRWEALETAACFHRRIPTMQIVLILGEDDPGSGYPGHVRHVGRPFDSKELTRALVGQPQTPVSE